MNNTAGTLAGRCLAAAHAMFALIYAQTARADAVDVNGYVINSVSGYSTTTNAPVLTVYAADTNGHVVASTVVTGSYWSLGALERGAAYTIVLSDTADVSIGGEVPAASLPPGWVNDADFVLDHTDLTSGGTIAVVLPTTGAANFRFGVHFAVAISPSERNVLEAVYQSAHGDTWPQKAGWNSPVGTECNWPGVVCDYDPVTPHVIWLGIGNQGISGTLPPIDDLKFLQILNVEQNYLTGPMPSLAGLVHLQEVWAWDNHFSGNLPSLSGLAELRVFVAFGNEFTGELPSLEGLSSLEEFQVHANGLTGTIPPLNGLVNLASFNVQGNYLTGSIPSLDGLTKLYYFNVGLNELTGTLPSLAGLSALQSFRASYNRLQGTIPSLDGLGKLELFAASHNDLTGTIPSLTGAALRQVFLQNNRLSGDVPTAPSNMYPNSSTLCPNLLNTIPSTKDAAWNNATGHFPWWANPYANNACDDLFTDGLEGE